MRRRYLSAVMFVVMGACALMAFVSCTQCGQRAHRIEGAVLRVANGTEIESMDPHLVTGVPEHRVMMACFEGLMRNDPQTGGAIAGAAESYGVSADGLTYTFLIRDGARWSNGEPMTAQDFVYSFRRIVNPETAAQYASMLQPVKNATAINQGTIEDLTQLGARAKDDRTLVVTLEQKTPYFIEQLTHYAYSPVPRGPIETHGNQWTHPDNILCNGPFTVQSVALQDRRTFVRNPYYWDSANVKLDGIVFYATDNQHTMTQQFRNNEVDWSTVVPTTDIPSFQGRPEYVVHPYFGTYYFTINTTKPPLSDVRVRKALAMTINRDMIAKQITAAGEVPTRSFVPPGIANYVDNFESPLAEDIEKAKALLAEAGLNKMPSIEILYNTSEDHRRVALAISQMWDQSLGVNVELYNKEWKIYLADRREGNFMVARAGWIGDYNDPMTFLDLFTTHSEFNDSGWSNARYDDLIEQSKGELDLQKRAKIFEEAEKILLDELPIIPIYHYVSKNLVTPKLGGWYPNLMDAHPYVGMYFKE